MILKISRKHGLQNKISKRAYQNLEDIISYIESNFGEVVKDDFRIKIVDTISLLQEFPLLGSVQNREKEIRGFVIHKFIKVFYKFQNHKVTILSFFDNRQKPYKIIRATPSEFGLVNIAIQIQIVSP